MIESTKEAHRLSRTAIQQFLWNSAVWARGDCDFFKTWSCSDSSHK